MAEESKYGSPKIPDENRGRMECAEFEALLADALEGEMTAARQQSFDAHRRVCAVCGPMFADVEAGHRWLKTLAEVEPPAHLVHNILIATSGVESTRSLLTSDGRSTPLMERLRERWDAFFTPVTAFVKQPRFAMSFGMIFFSFSLALSAAGVKPGDMAKIDLRPAALRHAYNDAQIKVVQYYDNIRFVYEIESRLRELKRANAPAEPQKQPEQRNQKDNRKNNDTSGQPEEKQDRNYSQQESGMVLAALTTGRSNTEASLMQVKTPPDVTVRVLSTGTTNRRFV
jgi:hypothetical protein